MSTPSLDFEIAEERIPFHLVDQLVWQKDKKKLEKILHVHRVGDLNQQTQRYTQVEETAEGEQTPRNYA
jgi:hypothetical protein